MRSLLILLACAGCTGSRYDDLTRLNDFIDAGARMLFVGAHPDDETLVGPMLGYGCMLHGLECHLAVLTRGESGRCALEDEAACADLAAVRSAEMQQVAARYGATLHLATFPNGPAEVGGAEEESLDSVRVRWEADDANGSPEAWISTVLREVKPDVVLSFDGDHGFTGHPEHRLTSQLLDAALAGGAAPAHAALFHTLNHYPALEPLIGRDPAAETELWHLRRSCGAEDCLSLSVEIAHLHASQASSILSILTLFPDEFEHASLARVD